MDKCHMESFDKVEIAKQAIKERMEEHQVSEHKPTAKELLVQLLSQLASLQEEGVEKLCPEVDGTGEKPKEQWDSLQEDDDEWDPLQEEGFEKWCPEVDETGDKPKEQLDSSQEEYVERLSPGVDKAKEEEKRNEQLDSLQEEGVVKSSPEVDKTEEIIKEVRNVKRQNLITHCLVSTMILLTVAWQISEVSLLLKVKSGLKNPFNFFSGIVKGTILKGARTEGDGEQSSEKQKPVSKPPLIKLPDLHLLDLPIFDSSDGE
ncbi:uncharacterized protein LOC142504770 [Primulina tabacum]|uniref:uncharacterized protein LOC142504770 n=1 Tax=Primulina tabacum TaxID=48773 RepID=UPI003F5989F0